MKKVVIYSVNHCPYCNMAKALLSRKNISFNEVNVSQSGMLKNEMIKKSGGLRTVPQIFIGEYHVGGYDDLHKLNTRNQLDELLK